MDLYDRLLLTDQLLDTAKQLMPGQPEHIAYYWHEQAHYLLTALVDAIRQTTHNPDHLRACLHHWPLEQLATLLVLTEYGCSFLQQPNHQRLGILATLRTQLAGLDPYAGNNTPLPPYLH